MKTEPFTIPAQTFQVLTAPYTLEELSAMQADPDSPVALACDLAIPYKEYPSADIKARLSELLTGDRTLVSDLDWTIPANLSSMLLVHVTGVVSAHALQERRFKARQQHQQVHALDMAHTLWGLYCAYLVRHSPGAREEWTPTMPLEGQPSFFVRHNLTGQELRIDIQVLPPLPQTEV